MNLASDLQQFIYDSINDSIDNNVVYFTSSDRLDIIINNLYKKEDFLSAANLLESLSVLDRNTYLLENNEQHMSHYIILSNMFFSCLLYKKVGLNKRASILASSAYIDLLDYYKTLASKETSNCEMKKAVYLEMIADFCLFINKELMEENYYKALTQYNNIDNVTQLGETCDWYWCFIEDRFRKIVLACYNINTDLPKLGEERINYKLSLFDSFNS